MSKDIFARVQLLLEETQAKIRKAEDKWQNSETQIRSLAQRVSTLEQQNAMLRVQIMQVVESVGKTHGNLS